MFINHYKKHFMHYQWVSSFLIWVAYESTRAFSAAWIMAPTAATMLVFVYWFMYDIRS